MNPTTKKILIGSGIAVSLGIIGYFVYDKIKKSRLAEEEKKQKEEADRLAQQNVLNQGTSEKVDETPKNEDSPKEEPQDEQVISKDLEKSISLIVAKADGEKANRTYLVKTNPTFVKKWSWAIDNGKRAFTWGGKTWRTKTGKTLLDFNPLGVKMKTKSKGTNMHWYANENSTYLYVEGNVNVGRVRAIDFDGKQVWFYLPDEYSNYKWGKALYFIRA